MNVEIQLFAAARQAANSDRVAVEIPDQATAADVIKSIGNCLPQLLPLLPSCRLAVNCCYVSDDTHVDGGSELALIPPVSGG